MLSVTLLDSEVEEIYGVDVSEFIKEIRGKVEYWFFTFDISDIVAVMSGRVFKDTLLYDYIEGLRNGR